MTWSLLFGIIALVLFVLAGLVSLWSAAPPMLGRINLLAWAFVALALYFILGGGTLVLGG